MSPEVLRPAKVVGVSLLMLCALVLVLAVSLLLGSVPIGLDEAWSALVRPHADNAQARLILLEIRLPRALMAAVVGFALALGGVVLQAMLRNPLAEPFILGVSSGAALGAMIGILIGVPMGLGLPLMAFLGALASIALLLALGGRTLASESAALLLTGVIINAFFSAVIMFLLSSASHGPLRSMLFWLYGDLSQASMAEVYWVLPVLLPATLVLYALARHLNLLSAGELTASRLGMDVMHIKLVLLLLVSLLTGAVVAFSGLIGFVGLVVPHLARMLLGADHRLLIPVAAFGGAIFVVAADTLARTLIAPSELPVGVISAFVGAPFFALLLRSREEAWRRF